MIEALPPRQRTQQELRSKRETEVADLKKIVEDEAKAHEQLMADMRQKHNQAFDELNEQLEQVKRNKMSVEKSKQALESEWNEVQIELKTLTQGKSDSEHRRKKAESQVQELQDKFGDSERQRQEMADKMAKMQSELDNWSLSFRMHRNCSKRRLVRNSTSPLACGSRRMSRTTCARCWMKRRRARETWRSRSATFQAQLADMKKKLDQETANLESAEEARKRVQRDADSLQQQLEEKTAAYDKLDKTKTRLQRELDDLMVDQDNLRQVVSNLDRKQKKFDQMLAEEKTISSQYAEERDRAEADAREKDTRALTLARELEALEADALHYQEDLATAERLKRQTQAERDEQDEINYGNAKNALLTEEKRRLEARIAQLEEDLEEELLNTEMINEHLKRTTLQMEQLTTELGAEHSSVQRLEGARSQLDCQNKELKLKLKLQELESTIKSKYKSTIASLEAKIAQMEEQLDIESKEHQQASRLVRRTEKKLKEVAERRFIGVPFPWAKMGTVDSPGKADQVSICW
ncbi:uncharacterized protein LOC144053184 [Vanacampus margaritifer]